MRSDIEVIWCSNQRRRRGNGWSFPPNVRKKLQELTAGRRVVHLFGGQARFGRRLDVDPRLSPDVVGDAWLPPFRRDAFDFAILDPPYFRMDTLAKRQLFEAAGWIALEGVIWFHTTWMAGCKPLRYRHGYLVRVGDSCQVRCLQVFAVDGDKRKPDPFFIRGPAVKYNRWLSTQIPLSLNSHKEVTGDHAHTRNELLVRSGDSLSDGSLGSAGDDTAPVCDADRARDTAL
jgi:hypothetical protein